MLESGPFRRMERRTPEKVYGGWERERVKTEPGLILPRPLRAKKRDRRSCEAGEGRVRARCGRRPTPFRRDLMEGGVNGCKRRVFVTSLLSFGTRDTGFSSATTLEEKG